MKKNLLTLALMCFALTISAAKPMKKATFEMKKANKAVMLNVSKMKVAEKLMKKAPSVRKAESDDIFGAFINCYDGENVEGFVQAIPDTLYNASKDIEIQVDETTTNNITCNVHVTKFGGYNIDMYGLYEQTEEEGNYIIFPEQVVLHNEGDGFNYDFYVYGVGEQYLELLSFTQEEDGSFYCDYENWWLYVVDHNTGEGLGYAAVFSNNSLKKVNGTSIDVIYSSAAEDWVQEENAAAIEDYEVAVSVYGFFDTKIDMNIDEDLTVRVPTGQPLMDQVLTMEDGYEWEAGVIKLTAHDKNEEGNMTRNYEKTEVLGKLSGNTIIIDDFSGASDPNEEGSSYGIWFSGAKFTLNEGNFQADLTRIQEVSMTREEKIKNTKTYNLMGQQVSRSKAKGTLIYNGHKFINK